jgi:hypothetical protein
VAAFDGVVLPRMVVIVCIFERALFSGEKALAFFFSFSPFPPFFYRNPKTQKF